jgi:hypothetical protein
MIQLVEVMLAAFHFASYCNCHWKCFLFGYRQANSLDQIGNWSD